MLRSRTIGSPGTLCGALIAAAVGVAACQPAAHHASPAVRGGGASVAHGNDLCPEPAPLFTDASISLARLPTLAKVLRLTARLAPETTIDPAADGIVITLTSAFGTFLDARIPGGNAWTTRSGAWQYRDPYGFVADVTRVTVRRGVVRRGEFVVTVEARRGDWRSAVAARPLRVTIVLDATGRPGAPCGVVHFSLARCRTGHSGRTLSCDPPRAPHRCSEPNANATIRCAALNAAAAQETYFATHGRYYSGKCGSMPDFTASDTVCVTSGGSLTYTVTTSSAMATTACIYSSSPRAGRPNLVCT